MAEKELLVPTFNKKEIEQIAREVVSQEATKLYRHNISLKESAESVSSAFSFEIVTNYPNPFKELANRGGIGLVLPESDPSAIELISASNNYYLVNANGLLIPREYDGDAIIDAATYLVSDTVEKL